MVIVNGPRRWRKQGMGVTAPRLVSTVDRRFHPAQFLGSDEGHGEQVERLFRGRSGAVTLKSVPHR